MDVDGKASRPDHPDDEVVLALAGEELAVTKQVVETGRVAVTRLTREQPELIAQTLAEETVEISREPIGRFVETMPAVREEGDTVVVPVVEERLVMERRLFLKEEVRVKRVRTSKLHRERVTLRHQDVVVSSVPAQTTPAKASSAADERSSYHTAVNVTPNRRVPMRYQTIVAAFDSRAHAQAAVDALKTAGFHPSDISLLDKKVAPESAAWTGKGPSLWQRLFGTDVMQHEAAVYHQAVTGGGAVVSVRVPDYEVAHATGILDLHHPIDVEDRAKTTGAVPVSHVEAAAASTTVSPLAAKQEIAVSPKLGKEYDQILRLAEEQLQVGKRMIETGKTRVRRFVTERDVSEDITLHEEHAEVLRRAVSDPKFLGDVDWADREIEVVETAEEALVSKTARVVEEVSLKKIGSDHVQTLHDKVRRQQVEVERLGPDGKRIVADKPTEKEMRSSPR